MTLVDLHCADNSSLFVALYYINNIRGRECFEGIEHYIDLCMSSVEFLDESLMVISPTPSIASQNLQQNFFQRKRKSCDEEGHEDLYKEESNRK